MKDVYLAQCLAVAQEAARSAGVLVKELRPRAQVRLQKGDGDLVTDGDLAAEEHVLSAIRRHFPGHGYCSEERGVYLSDAEYVWVLDPIDGTKYYAGDVPLYTVSLALRRGGEYVLGVVYAPEFDRMYSAAIGQGSELNGQPIHCSQINDLRRATICLEIPNGFAPLQDQALALKRMGAIVSQAFRVRIIGIASLGLCFCASGGFDAYLNLTGQLDPVDYAGGWAVAREAGAEVAIEGEWLIAGPPTLCRMLRDAVNV